MIQHADHFHGSDLEKIEKFYSIKKEDIISFSANVNPLGLSDKLKKDLATNLDVITRYPDREYTMLRQTIAAYCGSKGDDIIVGNGSTELISLVIKTVNPQKSIILGPTYSEYEHEISLSGGTTMYFPLLEEDNFILNVNKLFEKLDDTVDLLAICNPNNPTSGAITRVDLRKILDKCVQHNIFVLIDETYIEFSEEYEDINAIPLTHSYVNLAVLRGISKFFASPGLRLGYAITSSDRIKNAISHNQNAWSINSLAEEAGKIMFNDTEYIESTKALIFSERKRICKVLDDIPNLKYYPASANFILVKILDSRINADVMFENAIKQKLMIRNCSTFPFLNNSYFRFCIMNPEDNDRLLDVIKQTMAG